MSDRPHATTCPDPETLGAFADGKLTGEPLRVMNEHLATCEDCLDVLRTFARFRAEGAANVVPLAPRRRIVLPVAAGIVLALFLGAIVWMLRGRAEVRSPMAALIEAAPATYRRVEPRLAGFGWAELRRLRAGESAPPDPDALRLGGVAGEVLRRAERDSSPGAQHAAGVAQLLLAQPAAAVERLRGVTRRAPDDAAAWSDLAAAHYTSAVQANRPADLPPALAAADRALQLDPKNAAALFNRALILERMGLRDEAVAAWRDSLAAEPSSPWAVEAREHLAALTKPRASFRDELPRLEAAAAHGDTAAVARIVRAHPEDVRRWFEGLALGQWGEAIARGDAAAARKQLDATRFVAAALHEANGESLLAGAVAAIDRAGERLAPAHAAYLHARLRYRDHDLAAAERELLDAAAMFAPAGSPMASVSRFYAASVRFDQNRIGEAAALLGTIDIPAPHAALGAEVHALRGRCAMYEGRWSDAIADFTVAADVFRRLGETTGLALAEAALGDCWMSAGHRERAWEHRVEAFRLSDGSDRRIAAIAAAARAELRDERIESAEALLRVEIAEAERGGKPLLIADAYHRRALVRAHRGDDGGYDDLRLARAALARETDSGLRRQVASGCDLAAGVLARRRDARQSVALLGDAIAFQRAAGERLRLAGVLLERARSHRAAGDDVAAGADFGEALAELERQRGDDGAIFDTATSLLEESVELSLERGDAAGAFEVADRVHGRGLGSGTDAPATVAEVARALPPGAALVEYALVPRGIAAFCVTPSGLRAVTVPVERATLQTRMRELRNAIDRRADVRGSAEALHALLVAPLALGDASSLVIVADRELQALPWAALRDAARGQYLVERYEITLAPSAAVWMRNRLRAPARGGERLLLVAGDPGGGDLDVLDHVRAERNELESLYPDRIVLDADGATPARFLRSANECDVIHFTGHAERGALRMRGELRAPAVARAALTRPRLAVLAACSTLEGDASRVDGLAPLARAFLAAGVPRVIGTLWPVDDRQTAMLFGELHRRLRAGAAPAAALRDAQLSLIRAGHPPAAWAAAELVGG